LADRARQRLGLSPDDFVFLFVFDFASYAERKNPGGLIEAFNLAFSPRERARLVVKSVNGEQFPDAIATLQVRAAERRIDIVDGYWSTEDLADLYASCDAYVSLHRAEGLGLTMARAMALGKPAIATGWSGNLDFMDADNSFLVNYELVPIPQSVGPYRVGQLWAEPSIEHAAKLMREVFENPTLASQKGARAQRDLSARHSPEAVAKVIGRRLEQIRYGMVGSRVSGQAVSPDAGSAIAVGTPLSYARPGSSPGVPVLPPLEVNRSIHGWPGRLAKRAMSRLVRFQTLHQQQVNQAFARQVGNLLGAFDTIMRESARLRAELETARAELTELRQQVARQAEIAARHDRQITELGERAATQAEQEAVRQHLLERADAPRTGSVLQVSTE
jgi:hypothetical protein